MLALELVSLLIYKLGVLACEVARSLELLVSLLVGLRACVRACVHAHELLSLRFFACVLESLRACAFSCTFAFAFGCACALTHFEC